MQSKDAKAWYMNTVVTDNTGPCCINFTISGNFAINCNYHGNTVSQPIKFKYAVELTINRKPYTIDYNFEQWGTGPRCIKLTINGKLDFNGNYHRIFDADWL